MNYPHNADRTNCTCAQSTISADGPRKAAMNVLYEPTDPIITMSHKFQRDYVQLFG
jgi:hypothetical protein